MTPARSCQDLTRYCEARSLLCLPERPYDRTQVPTEAKIVHQGSLRLEHPARSAYGGDPFEADLHHRQSISSLQVCALQRALGSSIEMLYRVPLEIFRKFVVTTILIVSTCLWPGKVFRVDRTYLMLFFEAVALENPPSTQLEYLRTRSLAVAAVSTVFRVPYASCSKLMRRFRKNLVSLPRHGRF